jgi:pimeloyl-ACP methyl ester carboxylesterase
LEAASSLPASNAAGAAIPLFPEQAAEIAAFQATAARLETDIGGKPFVWHAWGDGPPVFLFHGSSGSWRHWFKTIPALAPHYRVIAADLPGYGDSGLPAALDGRIIGEAIVAGVDRLIGPDAPYHILAFSYGGQLSSPLLAAHTSRLVSISYLAPGGLQPVQSPMLEPIRDKAGAERIDAHRRNLKRGMIAEDGKIDPLAIQLNDENVALTRLRLTAEFRRAQRPLIEVLRDVQVPVNGLWGTADQWSRERYVDRAALLRETQKDARIAFVEGAGHWSAYEAADAVNRFLLEAIGRRAEQFRGRL